MSTNPYRELLAFAKQCYRDANKEVAARVGLNRQARAVWGKAYEGRRERFLAFRQECLARADKTGFTKADVARVMDAIQTPFLKMVAWQQHAPFTAPEVEKLTWPASYVHEQFNRILAVSQSVQDFADALVETPESGVSHKQPVRAKRSTSQGDARSKLISALSAHHHYNDGEQFNLEPIGNNELARKAEVNKSTASDFFKEHFKGHGPYKARCLSRDCLLQDLKLLNGDVSPHHTYGKVPPSERDRRDA